MRGTIIALFATLLLCGAVLAQTGTLEVKILDKVDGSPVVGANAMLTDQKTGVAVGLDGIGLIEGLVPHLDTLFISSIGYHRLAIPLQIKPDTVIHVEVKLPVGELEFPSYREKKLPRNYLKKNTKVTYVPINRNK